MNYIWQNKTVLAGEVSNCFSSSCFCDELHIDIESKSNIDVTLQESDWDDVWTDVVHTKINILSEFCVCRIYDGLKYRTARQKCLYPQKGLYRLRCNKESVMLANYVFIPKT
jgi:hypothetical protein